MEPLVCIIIPIYNAASYICNALESVKAQFYENWLCVLVDDCSSDNSKQIVEALSEKDNQFIVLSTEKNSGPAHTRNVGIEYAISHGAEFIAFFDSDDILESNYLSTLINVAENHSADIVWCNYFEYEFGRVARKRAISHRLPSMKLLAEKHLISCFFEERQGLGCLWNKLYRVKFITQHDLRINEDRVRAEDWEFNLMAFQSNPKVIAIEESLYNYIHYSRPSVMTTFREKDFAMYKRSLRLLSDVVRKYELNENMRNQYAHFLYSSICYIISAVLTCQDSSIMMATCNDSFLQSVVKDASLYYYLTPKQKIYAYLIRYKKFALLNVLIGKFK